MKNLRLRKTLLLVTIVISGQLIAQPFNPPPSSNQGRTSDNMFTFNGDYQHSSTGGSQGYTTSPPTLLGFTCGGGKISWNPVLGYYNPTVTNNPCFDILVNGTVTKWETHFGRAPVAFGSIQNTGNDIQILETDIDQKFEATVWDGDIPSFSFIDKNNPDAFITDPQGNLVKVDPTFIVQLHGSKIGQITDPDIVINPFTIERHGSNTYISILIVYELTPYGGGTKNIAVEQFNYNYKAMRNGQVVGELNPAHFGPKQIKIISNVDYDANNPNIDVNNFGQFAITYESQNNIHVYVDKFGDYEIPFDPNKTKVLASSYIDLPAYDPDVTIGSFDNSDEVTIVYNKALDFGLHAEVYPVNYSDVQNSSGIVLPSKPLTLLNESKDDPRIASPRGQGTEPGIAITTLHPHAGEVYFHTNIVGNGSITTYLAADYSTSLPECNNERPAITFSHENTITVGWTYFDCANISANEVKKAIALNFSFYSNAPTRTPNDPNYFMSVTKRKFEKQRYLSLSSVNYDEENSVYYSLFFDDPSNAEHKRGIAHKRSQTVAQPMIRKKQINNNMQLNTELLVYPNPSTGLVQLTIVSDLEEALNLSILNSLGQTVQEEEIRINGQLSKSLDLNYLEKGVYFISIQGQSESMKERIIIQ